MTSDKNKIWDTNKIINTDNLTDDQWDILADIFKDFKQPKQWLTMQAYPSRVGLRSILLAIEGESERTLT